MKNLITLIGIVSISMTAFGFTDEDTCKFKAVSLSGEKCQVTMTDLTDGLNVTGQKLETVHRWATQPRDGSEYPSSIFYFGPEKKDHLNVSVNPLVRPNGKLYFNILVGRSHEHQTGSNVELIGSQSDQGQIKFHGWSHKEFEARDSGRQFDVVGTLSQNVMSVNVETEVMKFSIQCDLK
jgi:hypothetical protein